MAEQLHKEPKQFLRALVHEELGLSEETFPNPWRSLLSASVSTAIGGFIPIIPFFFTVGMPAVIASFVISTLAHFAVGASKSLVTTRSWWASGAEMTMVGILEAAITYGVGVAFAGYGAERPPKGTAKRPSRRRARKTFRINDFGQRSPWHSICHLPSQNLRLRGGGL